MAKLKTGRHTSALKELRKTERRTLRNRRIRRKIRLLAKQTENAIASKKVEDAKKLLSECFAAWDKAVKSGVIHKNAANRKKSSLSKKLAKITFPSAA